MATRHNSAQGSVPHNESMEDRSSEHVQVSDVAALEGEDFYAPREQR